jgi:prepilin-type N-terminal cleavage/methylation domain-containing protein
MCRKAFTLVEILTVIIIIGMLICLIGVGASHAIRYSREAAVIVEVKKLEQAIQEFKIEYGDYPPDFANIDRYAALRDVLRFIYTTWPRCKHLPADFQPTDILGNQRELPPEYNAGTALVFWFGGVKNEGGEYIGFSKDPTNPFDIDPDSVKYEVYKDKNKCTARTKPWFEFEKSRLTIAPTEKLHGYWPDIKNFKNGLNRQIAGYVYFKENYTNKIWITQPASLVEPAHYVVPITNGLTTFPPFQLRCCGMDGSWWGEKDVLLVDKNGKQVYDDDGVTKLYKTSNGQWGRIIGAQKYMNQKESYDDLSNWWTGELQDSFEEN